MSAIHSFNNDLFISYAHIDNQPLADGFKGWVDTLHALLAIRLSQLLGSPRRYGVIASCEVLMFSTMSSSASYPNLNSYFRSYRRAILSRRPVAMS